MKKITFTIFLSFLTLLSYTQETSETVPAVTSGSAEGFLGTGSVALDFFFVSIALFVLILFAVATVLLNAFKKLEKELRNPSPFPTEQKKQLEYTEWLVLQKSEPGLWTKILGLKPIEQEKDILLHHQFDGIEELDNPTPAWFMWLFYGTIAIGIGYFVTYHVADWGKLQEDEYVAEVEEAKAEKDALLKTAGSMIDENTVKLEKDKAVLEAGAIVFNANCVACHGDKAQGMVGPNLTDEYWLHGGSINQVFKTIKYGVPEKGMVSWGKSLSPKQISDVTNYIKSLKGSNPVNPKAPQGEKES